MRELRILTGNGNRSTFRQPTRTWQSRSDHARATFLKLVPVKGIQRQVFLAQLERLAEAAGVMGGVNA